MKNNDKFIDSLVALLVFAGIVSAFEEKDEDKPCTEKPCKCTEKHCTKVADNGIKTDTIVNFIQNSSTLELSQSSTGYTEIKCGGVLTTESQTELLDTLKKVRNSLV